MGPVRLLISLTVIAVVGIWGYQKLADRVGGGDGHASPFGAVGQSQNIPTEFQDILGSFPTGDDLLRQGGSLPGVGALISGGDDEAEEESDRLRPFGDVGSRAAVLRVKTTVRRHLRTISRFTRDFERDPGKAAAVIDQVYSRRVLDELGDDGRKKLAEGLAGQPDDPARSLSVVQFHGVVASGRHALVLLDYRERRRFRRGGPWQSAPPERWQVTLLREDGRWRFVRGFD
jgi:hypothetical protein